MSQHLKSPIRTRTRMPFPTATESGGVTPQVCTPLQIHSKPISELIGPSWAVRRRKKQEIRRHADCIEQHRYNPPVVVDEHGRVVFGEGHFAAYQLLKRDTVPTIVLSSRSPADLEAIKLWLEGFHASGEWAEAELKASFEFILEHEPDLLGSTFWELGDIDLLLHGGEKAAAGQDEPEDDATPTAVTRTGDIFIWPQGHRLICGNSRLPETYTALMGGRTAQLLATDPPYGIAVADISSTHAEWKEGSGMTEPQAAEFFESFLTAAKPHVSDGALVYLFIDGKGMYPLLGAVRKAGLEQKAICTWDKLAPGLGGFYRNQSEHVIVAKHGKAKHVFNAKCGQNTTIWSAPGYAQFRPDRAEALEAHACTKPQAILMGILLAGSNIGGLCLDPFMGSGSMMLAAQRTRRVCFGIEIEERFVDTTVRRMKALTGDWPVHEASGLSFDLLALERGVPLPAAPLLADDEL